MSSPRGHDGDQVDDASSSFVAVGARQVELSYGAATDVGLVREANEDSLLAEPPVFVVADGMGGHDGGEIASRIVVEEFARIAGAGYDPRSGSDAVLETLRSCQRRLHEYAGTHRAADGGPWDGGTTAVAALLVEEEDGPRWLLANVGDSRIYRVTGGELVRVSTDHSLVQQMVDAGRITEEQARVHPERHIVTRALGGPDPVHPDFFSVPLVDAERILLCSDGVTDLVGDTELGEVLRDVADPRDAAHDVVAAALAAGGIDNATAVVVDVMGLADEGTHDSRRQRQSPTEKHGAPP
jgi:PPM family protein phosphatase